VKWTTDHGHAAADEARWRAGLQRLGNATFLGQLRWLRQQHARKPSLLDRFDRAGLG
jgi:hypothetical protein